MSNILDKSYSRQDFIGFIEVFLPDDFRISEATLSLSGNQNFATSAFRLGECKSLELEVFEVHHSSMNDARVGIAKDAFRMLLRNSYCNRALVAFVPDNSGQWRFSLLQMDADINDLTNRIKRSYSNPRRHSFLLGEGSAIKTPTQFLVEKGQICQRKEGNKTLTPWEDLQYRFSIEALTKDFYNKLYNWYLWAVDSRTGVTFPNNIDTDQDDRENIQIKIIRLITRMLFVWFVKQKQLVPNNLFDTDFLKSIIKDFNPEAKGNGDYYNAILQNLFFATLNQEIEGRKLFTTYKGVSSYYSNKQLYRDTDSSYFTFPKKERERRILELFKDVPYLNGGLFECLDKFELGENNKLKQVTNFDGFSHENTKSPNGNFKKKAFVPNALFFAPEHIENVTTKVSENGKSTETNDIVVMGLVELFRLYNFTVEENTASDKEVSLDPELLGRVFENLLAAYNPETKESARKSTGSFYTPREIVDYMVEESLIAYLSGQCGHDAEEVRRLVKDENETQVTNPHKVIDDLKGIKILDPACGSGAFPMGILLKITDIIERLTPEGEFNRYETKLDIIKNCIYGVDIQAIAMLICKLRFFISLICDCDKDASKPNFGITPLPNLETKFVAANSLLPAKVKAFDNDWTRDPHLQKLQKELLDLRLGIFDKRTHEAKKNNKIKDHEKCHEIEAYIRETIMQPNEVKIAMLEKQISDDEAQLPLYERECWKDDVTQPQTSLFEDLNTTPTLFRRDINKEKREFLQDRIRKSKAEIEKERNKSTLPGFEEAVQEITKWDPYDQNAVSPFFDAEWMFGMGINCSSKQGFDIVIGNPPYFNIQKLGAHSPYAESVKRVYSDIWQDKSDILFYFIKLALKLSKDIICFITSNAFLFSDKAQKLRNYLLEDKRLNKIVNFEKYNVFGSASITTCITLFTNTPQDISAVNVRETDFSLKSLMDYVQNPLNCHTVSLKKDSVFALVTSLVDDINNKIDGSHKRLNALFKIGKGMETAANGVFCITKCPSQFPSEYIKHRMCGEKIKKYIYDESTEYLLYLEDVNQFDDLPKTIQDYLISNKETLCNRAQIKRSSTSVWWKYVFPMHKEYYHLNKIWCSYRCKTNTFALDESNDNIGLTNTTVIFDTNNNLSLKYLLALLNSKILSFRYKSIGKQTGGGVFEYFENGVGKLPIPEIKKDEQDYYIDKIDKIIAAKKKDPQADTSALENEIDNLVYHLYGLTYDEVLIVDPNTPITKEEYEKEQ